MLTFHKSLAILAGGVVILLLAGCGSDDNKKPVSTSKSSVSEKPYVDTGEHYQLALFGESGDPPRTATCSSSTVRSSTGAQGTNTWREFLAPNTSPIVPQRTQTATNVGGGSSPQYHLEVDLPANGAITLVARSKDRKKGVHIYSPKVGSTEYKLKDNWELGKLHALNLSWLHIVQNTNYPAGTYRIPISGGLERNQKDDGKPFVTLRDGYKGDLELTTFVQGPTSTRPTLKLDLYVINNLLGGSGASDASTAAAHPDAVEILEELKSLIGAQNPNINLSTRTCWVPETAYLVLDTKKENGNLLRLATKPGNQNRFSVFLVDRIEHTKAGVIGLCTTFGPMGWGGTSSSGCVVEYQDDPTTTPNRNSRKISNVANAQTIIHEIGHFIQFRHDQSQSNIMYKSVNLNNIPPNRPTFNSAQIHQLLAHPVIASP